MSIQSLNVIQQAERVLVVVNNFLRVDEPWQAVERFARELREVAEGHREECKLGELRFLRETDQTNAVVVTGNESTVCPSEIMLQIAGALLSKVREADEHEHALAIAADQALLLRAGMPVGLADRPDIQAEALKLAQHDPKLRRAIKHPRRPLDKVGRPRVIQRGQVNDGRISIGRSGAGRRNRGLRRQ